MDEQPFHHQRVVRFGECDPAGVVYYPVFFHWFHEAMEAWFSTAVGIPYADVLKEIGFPAARTEADFKSPCRLGEPLHVHVDIERLGTRSLTLSFTVKGAADGVVRAKGRTVCVCIRAKGEGFAFAAANIPPVLHQRLKAIAASQSTAGASPQQT